MKVWFIKYRWKRVGEKRWAHGNRLLEEHPLEWLRKSKTKYAKDSHWEYEYVLDFYIAEELPKGLMTEIKELTD